MSGSRRFTYPPKPRPGDRVAILSPSSALPGAFPLPYEVGLRRLREEFALEPVEYPTTRQVGASPAARAADVHAAFADPTIGAILCSIGGTDELTVLRHLDPKAIARSPKLFFGYSDNTNLLAFLYRLGIVAFHGGAVMVQFGRPGSLHPITAASLRAALFSSGPYELQEATESGDRDGDWNDSATFAAEPVMEPCEGWQWPASRRVVEGRAWGGNLEVLAWMLMADLCIEPPEAYTGGVFILETSEEMPSAVEVYRILRSLGERGILGQFGSVLAGRPKAWWLTRRTTRRQRQQYRADQAQAIRQAVEEYAPDAVLVLDVDLGHTDPQQVIPIGGVVRVDASMRRITVTY